MKAVRNVAAIIAGLFLLALLIGAIERDEPQQPIEGRPWNEILTPEQRGQRTDVHRPDGQAFTPPVSKEDRLMEKLGDEDYYDHSDYNGGLDGEHSDMDYSEVDDYLRD